MDHRLIEGLMEAIAPVIKESIAKATGPLIAQISELKTIGPIKGDPGEPGKSVTPEDLRPMVEETVAKLPLPQDGKSVSLDDVRPMIEEMVAAIPMPKDGRDADPAAIELMVSEAVAKIPVPQDGKSVSLDDVRPILEEMVAAIPKAKDGADVDPVAIELMVNEAVAKIPVPQDGKSVSLDDVRPVLEEMVAAIPMPKDGRDGVNGADAPMPSQEQIIAAVKTFDVGGLIRNALTAESRKDGIDVLAPFDVSQEMTNAVLMLSEPFPEKSMDGHSHASAPFSSKPRSFRFERDGQNRIVAAYEE